MSIIMSAHDAASSAPIRKRKSGTVVECSVTAPGQYYLGKLRGSSPPLISSEQAGNERN